MKLFIKSTLTLLALSMLSAAARTDKPLEKSSFTEIIKRYLFINDFSTKPQTRPLKDHMFWAYQYKIPAVSFPVYFDLDHTTKELPATTGHGREYEHLNRGRVLFLQGEHDEARRIWLSGRHRFGTSYPYDRRNNYFIALAYLALAKEKLDKNIPLDDEVVKGYMSNVATFLNWALITKKDHPDPLIDNVLSKQYYNLAAIYFHYKRYSWAYKTADQALTDLRDKGRVKYRSLLRRILAESHIKNHTYLEAIKELDQALRQDPNPSDASAIFARVGDIYFNLNNYELAENSYGLANRINHENGQINPSQFVRRGESLFWMGKFNEAQKNFYYGISMMAQKNSNNELSKTYAANAHLRIADSFLAQKKYDKAKIEYFRVAHNFPGTEQASIAKMRNACLNLPSFDGNNVAHTRKLLKEVKDGKVLSSLEAIEIAWTCEVASYAQRERTPDMLKRVKEFYHKYPDSKLISSLISPVKEVKAKQFDEYLAKDQKYEAIKFFEQNRKLLFKKISLSTKQKLFEMYMDVYQPKKALEFWSAYKKSPSSLMKIVRELTLAAELHEQNKQEKWLSLTTKKTAELTKLTMPANPDEKLQSYIDRLKNLSTNDLQLPWMYPLAKLWAKANPDYLCEMQYPLLSRLVKKPNKDLDEKFVEKEVLTLVDKNLPHLLETNASCGNALLSLEADVLKTNPVLLSTRYLARREWEMTRTLVSQFWLVAEQAAQAKQFATAKELWDIIINKSPKGSPEIPFAKARVDQAKTEYQNLWR